MQSDPAAWLSEPFAHELGMMIARVVEKDMDQHEHRIERLDRLQETDRRGGVDCQRLDHPGLAGLQIDRTVNVDALTPARLFDRELLLAWRPAARWPRGMGWMHCVNEQHSFFCLLYTSDAADDLLCVDLGGRRIIKKKKLI